MEGVGPWLRRLTSGPAPPAAGSQASGPADARPPNGSPSRASTPPPSRPPGPRVDPATEPAPEPAPGPAPVATAGQVPPPPAGPASRRRWLLPLAALATALAALGTVLGVTLGEPPSRGAEGAALAGARAALESMLSYDHRTFDAQAARSGELLTGDFKKEFATTMATTIKPLAVKNRSVVQARVYEMGVMDSPADRPDTVRVLAFLNQAKVSADLEQPAVDQNRVVATMTRVGDRWLLSGLEAY